MEEVRRVAAAFEQLGLVPVKSLIFALFIAAYAFIGPEHGLATAFNVFFTTSIVTAAVGAYFSLRRLSQAASSAFLIFLFSSAFMATAAWPDVKAFYAAYASLVPKGASYLGYAVVAAVAAPFLAWLAEYVRTYRAKIPPAACPEDVAPAQLPPVPIVAEVRDRRGGQRRGSR